MSSTNTKERKEQNPEEFYPTPIRCTEALLRAVSLPILGRRKNWLEPCAGQGAIVNAANAYWRREGIQTPIWDLNEINARHGAYLAPLLEEMGESWGKISFKDARQLKADIRYDVAITNPPFSLAGEIFGVLRLMATYTVLLLPTGFLGAAKRYRWLSQDMPDVGILTPRPSFTQGGNDSATYAWMIWGPKKKTEGKVFLLPTDEEMTSTAQAGLFEAL